MKGSVVTFGAITKDLLKSFNFKPPTNWASAVHKTSLYYFNNKGMSFGEKSSSLGTFSNNSCLEVTIVKRVMKIEMNKRASKYDLSKGKDFFFFFSLEGNT